mgnify:CR=1 FL=1
MKPCRKALPALQRGPYGFATGLPLRFNGSPVATSGEPYGRKTAAFPTAKSSRETAKILASEPPGGLPGAASLDFPAKNKDENIKKSPKKGRKTSWNEENGGRNFVNLLHTSSSACPCFRESPHRHISPPFHSPFLRPIRRSLSHRDVYATPYVQKRGQICGKAIFFY